MSFGQRWIQQLVERYNAFGPAALGDRRRANRGVGTVLKPELLERLRARLREPPPERRNEWIRAHGRIENGSHYVHDTAFAEDASRIRMNPDFAARLRSFAYNLIRADGAVNVRNTRWRAALDLNFVLKMLQLT